MTLIPQRLLICLCILATGSLGYIFEDPTRCFEAPKICPNENITFYLYTSHDNTLEYKLSVDDEIGIREAPFIRGAPLKFILHGYTGDRNYTPNPQLRKAFFSLDKPVNIISIDYKNLVLEGCYITASVNTDSAARCAAQFLDFMFDQRSEFTIDDLHIIGLSLGAQVAGQIANYFHKGPIKWITGLDPAAPLFYGIFKNDTRMLSANDAVFVDVLHTNIGMRGKLFPIGHLDFYANLGVFQPGCNLDSSCSHERAAYYYAEAITSEVGFWGYTCPSFVHLVLGQCLNGTQKWNKLGEDCDKNAPGIYFFSTNDKPPFAQGKYSN